LVRSGAAAATTNKVLAAVKGVLQQCWQSGLLDGETLSRCKASLKSVRGSTVPKGRHIPKGEIARLFRSVSRKPNPAAARDAAVLALMCIGLRRAEIASLRVGDYQSDSGRLLVRGKGGKERVVFLTNGAKAAVDDWIAVRGEQTTDALLLAVNKGGLIQPAGITAQSVYAALVRRAAEAGVSMTPHDFRRTFIGEALSAGNDLVVVQGLAGHSSPSTTARYDRRGDDVKRSAMATVSVPYLPCGG
jgi:integrase